MRFSRFEKEMFRVALEGSRDEVLSILDFLHFLYTENVRDILLSHPLGPSNVWKTWADETYVGFSTGRLMFQSGNRFAPAESTQPPSRLPWRRDRFDTAAQRQVFERFYPAFRLPPEHKTLFATHPASYWRMAEAVELSGFEADRMLEIGAGACVHVAYRHLLNPGMETVVIDLPESMIAGYILLRIVGIDVALPHENRNAPVVMRLPFQSIEGDFDFGFNMSSFQEMELTTVNNYIRLIQSHLKPGAIFQHINLCQSKQLPDNRAADYELNGFGAIATAETPYHSSIDTANPSICVIARKTGL